MLDVFEKILGVAKALLGLSDQLQAVELAKRERAAKLFTLISDCLTRVSADIRAGNVPHGSCAELQTYAQQLPQVIKPQVGNERAEQLGADLDAAHNTESGAVELSEEADPGPYLKHLDEAAGKFRALANLVTAGH